MSKHLQFYPWLATLFVLLLIPAAFAHTTWYSEPTLVMDGLLNGRDLRIVDIDDDGDQDIVVVTRADELGNVILFVNISDEVFVPVVVDGNFSGASAIDVGDLDADGDVDIVVSGRNRIQWYRNDGENLFTNFYVVGVSSQSYSVRVNDMNDDGEMDILACSFDTDHILYLANDGEENFTVNVISETCDGVTEIKADDIDDDGDLDVIAAARVSDQLIWYENEGVLPFTEHIIASDHDAIHGVDSGDFNGDGYVDIAVAVYGDDSYLLYENNGDASFTLIELELNAVGAWGVKMADIDSDGDDDVFCYANFNHDIFWYEYDVNGLFMEHSIDHELIGYYGLDVGDINGDNLPDLAGMVSSLGDQNELHWWSATSIEDWTEHNVDNSVGSATDVQAADLDLDGDLDLVGAGTGGDRIILYENMGAQVYEESELFPLPGAYALWIEDMDDDGYPDILCASGEVNDIRLYTNDQDMTFTQSYITNSLQRARSVHACDMDDDGDMDVIGTGRTANDVVWYENNFGNFIAHPVDQEFAGATDAIGVDLDQDGDFDILACGQLMDELAWYQNDGEEAFTKILVDSGLDGIRSAVAADFDDDGDLDVAATLYVDNTVAWWENNGAMLFTRHDVNTDILGAFDIVVADLNGTGSLDLVVSAEESDSLLWFANDGAGNFTMSIIDGDYEHPRGICVADLNEDDRPDVIAASNRESQIQWWENHFATNPDPVTVTLQPVDPPIEIPDNGGLVNYDLLIERVGSLGEFDVWSTVTHVPTSNSVTTWTYENLLLAPGDYQYRIMQYIWHYAPSGEYVLGLYIGVHPWIVHSYDSLDFVKSAGQNEYVDMLPVFDDVRLWPVNSELNDKLNTAGISVLEDEIAGEVLPEDYALSVAYPNPFNPTTTISMDLPEASHLSMTVYNINGQEVAELAEGRYVAGEHQFTFDASNLTSGLYFIHATVPGQFSQVRKVTLMK